MAEDIVSSSGESPQECARRRKRDRDRERYATDPVYRERQKAKKRAQYATKIATEAPDEKDARLAKQRVANRASYQRHLQKRRARIRQYEKEHPDVARAGQHRYNRTEKAKARDRRYLETNPVRRREIALRSRQKTYPLRKETLNAKRREERKVFPERFKDMDRRTKETKRARKQQIKIDDFSLGQWREIMAACDYQCVYCSWLFPPWMLTREHLTPIVDGGNHTVQNILPACLLCNVKKHTGAVLKPVQPFLLTLAHPRKLARSSTGQEG